MSEISQSEPIYLDYNATTYIHEDAAAEMLPYLTRHFGNPSSSHHFGNQTKMSVQNARERVAQMINCQSSEIVFTSGGSESNNYAIKGAVLHLLKNSSNINKLRIMTSQIEHPSVLEVFRYLEKQYPETLEVIYLPVNSLGAVDIPVFTSFLNSSTGFISVMHANNETGVIQPIKELSDLGRKINPDLIFHSDAAQSIGKTPVAVDKLGVDMLSICPHKFYGPKGIGALYISSGTEKRLEKLIHGANHEKNLRAGTENVLEIVGLGKASELVTKNLSLRISHFADTRDLIYQTLCDRLGSNNVKLHGPPIEIGHPDYLLRLSNTLFVSFPGLEANLILDKLSNVVACSAGAACHSDEVKMSHVLSAMKVKPELAMGTLRLSTGIRLSKEKALEAANAICETVLQLRSEKQMTNENEEMPDLCEYSTDSIVKLTKTTHGLGCGCKLSATTLSAVISGLGKQKILSENKNILVGTETSDDACVYKISDQEAVISTLDFFTPICDDPWTFGAISCANALSDVYAMGGKPIFGLNIVGFPIKTMSPSVLKQILRGAQEKAEEAGVAILGGHSIEDPEPKFGLSVTGLVHPDYIWRNSTMSVGDIIVLTKKIGVGAIMTGLKRGLISDSDSIYLTAIDSMQRLNRYASEVLNSLEKELGRRVVNACTDITGFGLLGHLKEALESSQNSARVFFDSVPFIGKVKGLIEMGVIPGGTVNNSKFVDGVCEYDQKITSVEKSMINDPQTSGGLMIFVKEEDFGKVGKAFEQKKIEFYPIGRVEKEGKGRIYLKAGRFEL